MKKNIKRLILIVLIILNCTIIFEFSSQNGEQSGEISNGITRRILEKIRFIQDKQENEREDIILRAEMVIRKIAHFSIYTLLGLLWMAFFNTFDMKEKYKIMSSLLMGILYSISDEIHQSFIPERSAQITDVMLDSMGVVLGVLMIMLFTEIIKRFNQERFEYK